jgi:Flp pilus assembly pilin Flp
VEQCRRINGRQGKLNHWFRAKKAKVFQMLMKCVAKIFALEPKANAIEVGIIAALVMTAVLVTLLAVREPLAAMYSTVVGDFVVGAR